jgi:hypothetical protein
MAIVATLDTVLPVGDTTGSAQIARGSLAFTGNYPLNGDVLNLALYSIQSNYPPIRVFVYEQPVAGTAASGYRFVYAVGTNPSNGQLILLESAGAAAPDAPFPPGAYPVFAAGTIRFEAIFLRGQ